MMPYKILIGTMILSLGMKAQAKPAWNPGPGVNLVGLQYILFDPIVFVNGPAFSSGAALEYRRILSSAWELNVSAGFFSGKYDEFKYLSEESYAYRIVSTSGSGRFRETGTFIAFRKYRKRRSSVAPIGRYYKFGLANYRTSAQSNGYTYQDGMEVTGADGTTVFDVRKTIIHEVENIKVNSTGLILGFGREMAISEKLFFGFGVDMVLTRQSLKFHDRNPDSQYEQFESFSRHLFRKNLVTAHYSLSYIF